MRTRFEFFSGTGGVGKTTISASRAFHLSKSEKVLLVTIDPAHRLKDLSTSSGSVDTLLFDPEVSFNRLLEEKEISPARSGRIHQLLFKKGGGMNEIMAVVELLHLQKQAKYDVIVVDTAPHRHFVEFFENIEKIKKFFSLKYLELFSSYKKKPGFLGRIVSTAGKKFLDVLKSLTGSFFIDEFIKAIEVVFLLKDKFLETNEFIQKLIKDSKNQWFFVSSFQQQKALELSLLEDGLSQFTPENISYVLNQDPIEIISDIEENHVSESVESYGSFLSFKREDLLKKLSQKKYITFPEIVGESPKVVLEKLINKWTQYD